MTKRKDGRRQEMKNVDELVRRTKEKERDRVPGVCISALNGEN